LIQNGTTKEQKNINKNKEIIALKKIKRKVTVKKFLLDELCF